MSRFFVGQRVRLVRPFQAGNMGKTGVIASMFSERPGRPDYPINCDVRWDQGLTPFTASQTHTSRLEPIQPDGARPSEFKTLHDLLSSLEGVRT